MDDQRRELNVESLTQKLFHLLCVKPYYLSEDYSESSLQEGFDSAKKFFDRFDGRLDVRDKTVLDIAVTLIQRTGKQSLNRVTNSISTAAKGKGTFALLKRARAIVGRYGLTSAKIEYALSQFASTLQQFECKATFPVTAVALARHSAIIEKYQAQGIEFAIHGLVHVDHTQLSLNNQRANFSRAWRIFERAGIHVTGFRCPYLRWNADTLAALGECGFAYDSSQALAWDVVDGLATDDYHRVLAFYRAQAAADYPSLPRLTGGLVRIPYCMPDDEAMVERLQLTDGQAMAELWLEVLLRVHEAGELFTLGLHPERIVLCREALRAVLKRARSFSPAVWIARLDELATWWQALEEATFEVAQEVDGRSQLAIKAPPEATVLIRAIEVEALTQPWTHGYQRVPTNSFSFWGNRRPFIGLAPDSSPALRSFLRQQGYLVEIGADAQAYPFYIHRTRFTPHDERSLLAEIEKGDWPLVRLGRWPGGAQSALCITGDIDAFTLWDYGLRAWGR